LTFSAYGAVTGARCTTGFEVDFSRMMALAEMTE